MITFRNVCFSYKRKNVLNNFSLEIKDGERLCLSGASGCGKTTVLRLLLGLEKPQSGTVISDGNPKFSVVFQEDRLIPHKTVKENIALFSDEKTADYYIKKLGLYDFAASASNELSGGQKRRVAIARAVSHPFDILVLDEAMNGLDDANKKIAADVILEAANGKTIITVTHNDDETQLLNAVTYRMP